MWRLSSRLSVSRSLLAANKPYMGTLFQLCGGGLAEKGMDNESGFWYDQVQPEDDFVGRIKSGRCAGQLRVNHTDTQGEETKGEVGMKKRIAILIAICTIISALYLGSTLVAQPEEASKGPLFVMLLTMKPNLPPDAIQKSIARRAEWQAPEGVEVIAEYWLAGPGQEGPNVIAIFKAPSSAPIYLTSIAWGDIFDIEVHPAVTADEGLALASKMLMK